MPRNLYYTYDFVAHKNHSNKQNVPYYGPPPQVIVHPTLNYGDPCERHQNKSEHKHTLGIMKI